MYLRLLVPTLVATMLGSTAGAAQLPLSRVVLYSTGVGYFEHRGTVEGEAAVSMSFRVEQINDLLKSLVVQDFDGGRVGVVSYPSQDPVSRQLQAFSVQIADNPSLGELLERLRGAAVEVEGPPNLTGTILGVEEQEQAAGETTLTVAVLNLLTERGVVAVPLPQVRSVRLVDEQLNRELQGALATLAAGRDVAKRELALSFQGQGSRRVMAGYLLETPVWKTTYRLVHEGDGLHLQGWAIVENTTDADWERVDVALVAGQPVSFSQDLYQALYAYRPRVPVSVPVPVAPRVHDGVLEMAPPPASMAAPAPARREARTLDYEAAEPGMMEDVAEMLAPATLAGRGVQAAAVGAEAGEFFEYRLAEPVTIPRQQSAMLPIVNTRIEGEKVSVYNESFHAKHPLSGMRLTNTSGLHLMAGAVTVFDGGMYGGDALLEDLTVGGERLITYAVDLGTEVAVDRGPGTDYQVAVRIDNGVIIATRRLERQVTYSVKNRTDQPRTVLVEQPLQSGWELVEPTATEQTRDLYRFAVTVGAGALEKLSVTTRRPIEQRVALVDSDEDTLRMYLQSTVISDAVKTALQEVARRRAEISQVAEQRRQREARLEQIDEEQSRIRQNMAQLPRDSDLYKQYVEKLTEQEAEFDQVRQEGAQLLAREQELRRELNEYLRTLTLE